MNIPDDKVNILLVDDQPAKLLSYEAILRELGENLIKANSGKEALEHLLKTDIAVVLMDVSMPELDGFELAAMIREHPRFRKTAIIFVSAIHLTDVDHQRGYEMGAVDYVSVPVIPNVLRAKVRVFAELYRKTRQLQHLNAELERRVAERTAELQAVATRLQDSEKRRNLALAAGQMGSWDWDVVAGDCIWDEAQCQIFGIDADRLSVTFEDVRNFIHPDDWPQLRTAIWSATKTGEGCQAEFRVRRPTGELRWCIGTAGPTLDEANRVVRISGVTIDITERKADEERQGLLAREVDHRARNALAVMQSIIHLTRADNIGAYVKAVDGRIKALARAHTLLSESRWQGADLPKLVDEEFAPFRTADAERVIVKGPAISLDPAVAQALALALHELATNAAKHGALSTQAGRVTLSWYTQDDCLELEWIEEGGPPVHAPTTRGFGTRVISVSVREQLGGVAMFDWRPQGLRCVLRVPRRGTAGASARNMVEHRIENGGLRGLPITAGGQVLLLEDEALVGMMMTDMLHDLELGVLGPFTRTNEAIEAVANLDVDAAILDINLGSDTAYPLADVLVAKGIPFIFVSGYGSESIDPRFANVPILQKPIERQVLYASLHLRSRQTARAVGR